MPGLCKKQTSAAPGGESEAGAPVVGGQNVKKAVLRHFCLTCAACFTGFQATKWGFLRSMDPNMAFLVVFPPQPRTRDVGTNPHELWTAS